MTKSIALAFALACLCGCASNSDSTSTSQTKAAAVGSDGVAYEKHKHIQKAWFAEGFDFTGYDTLLITDTKYAAKERPNEVEMRAWAVQYLQNSFKDYIRTNHVFANVVTKEADVKPGAKTLRMENTIFEYEKGGGGARYWVGLYGGGQPVLKVRGQFVDGDKPLCKFEASRSGESAGARLVGAFKSDQDIQTEDIKDLGLDMSDFILRTSKHLSTK
jgi:hypothetical protein